MRSKIDAEILQLTYVYKALEKKQTQNEQALLNTAINHIFLHKLKVIKNLNCTVFIDSIKAIQEWLYSGTKMIMHTSNIYYFRSFLKSACYQPMGKQNN